MNCYGKYLVIVMCLMVGLLFVTPTVPYAQEECASRDGCNAGSEGESIGPQINDLCPDNTSSATVKPGDTICICSMPNGKVYHYISTNGSCKGGCSKLIVNAGSECYYAEQVALSYLKDCPEGCTESTTKTISQSSEGCTITYTNICTPSKA